MPAAVLGREEVGCGVHETHRRLEVAMSKQGERHGPLERTDDGGPLARLGGRQTALGGDPGQVRFPTLAQDRCCRLMRQRTYRLRLSAGDRLLRDGVLDVGDERSRTCTCHGEPGALVCLEGSAEVATELRE